MITLTVTPGLTWTNSTVANATALNAAANPTVTLDPAGNIGPEYLNMPLVIEAVGTAALRNYIRRANFSFEDWRTGAGEAVPAGEVNSNTAEWFARPVGGAVTVRRVAASPDDLTSTWAAELEAGAGLTDLAFYTWVPPSTGGALRDGDITFSLWVNNQRAGDLSVQPFLEIAVNTNDRTTLAATLTGPVVSLPADEWRRLELTFDAGDYDLSRGFALGVKTDQMTSSGDRLRVAQAQLEAGDDATAFARPPLLPGEQAYLREIEPSEEILGARLAIQLGSGELRLLPSPPAAIFNPILGFNRTLGLPEWLDGDGELLYLYYTGADQLITVPSGLGITAMEVNCWGGGAAAYGDRPGGVGGYTRGQFPCTGGDQFMAVVGRAGVFVTGSGPFYSFAGDATAGGLTGIFTGAAAVVATDSARARVVAGGGGICNGTSPPSPAVAGGNGNDLTSSGGEATFAGAPGISGSQSGGGGGFSGGGYGPSASGKAGSGYLHTAGAAPLVTLGVLEYTTRSTPVTTGQILPVPGASSPYYQNQAGAPGKPGLMVIKWII